MRQKLSPQTVDALRAQRRLRAISGSLFEAQRIATSDPARKKAYCTTRRAGKTTAVLSDFIEHGLQHPRHQMIYIALTRPSAEGIAWPILRELNERFDLDAQFKEAKLQMILPNKSALTLLGADRPGMAARLYGRKLAKVAIDEAAFYSINLYDLIADYLEPATADLNGQIIMTSTPGHRPAGFFYDVIHGNEPGWSTHSWTALQNPHMKAQFEAKMAQLRAENPEVENEPAYQRNYLGKFVAEDRDMVYSFNPARNLAALDSDQLPQGLHYVLGVDLGWHDPTAFTVIAYSKHSPITYVLESDAQSELLLDAVAAQIRMYMDTYPSLKIVGDPSRRQAFEELRRRYQLPVVAAERPDKETWIEVINNDLVGKRILIDRERAGGVGDEMLQLGWAYRPSGKRVEDPRTRNDRCDAMMMAYRMAYAYRHKRPLAEPKAGSPEWVDREADRIEQELADKLEAQLAESW